MMQEGNLIYSEMIKRADQYPNKIAFRCNQNELTYTDLKSKSNQVAQILKSKGVKKGDRVGILMNRCIETSFAIYGILLYGAVYVPIDPKAPLSRQQHIINQCGIKVILTTIKIAEKSEELNVQSISVDQIGKEDSQVFSKEWGINEDDLAYILYTSGSTGQPKGICHTHKSGFEFAQLCAETFGLKKDDIIGNHAPIFFDISTLAYFAGPMIGACTTIVPDMYTLMPASMVDLLHREKVTTWYSVPLAITQMMETGKFTPEYLPHLQTVFYAGEAFPFQQLKMLKEEWPQLRIVNLFGPTETNVCTYFELPEGPLSLEKIPIGLPWGKTSYLVRDSELLISSVTTMEGYWQNEEMNQRAFVNVDGAKYYKTGDLVTEEEGVLYLTGRKDHQIKIRGYRVELGDIESAFLKHPNVKEVVAIPIEQDGKVEAIHVAVLGDKKLEEKSLPDYVKSLLPTYAIPSKIYIMTDFPRTRNGKIERSEIRKRVT